VGDVERGSGKSGPEQRASEREEVEVTWRTRSVRLSTKLRTWRTRRHALHGSRERSVSATRSRATPPRSAQSPRSSATGLQATVRPRRPRRRARVPPASRAARRAADPASALCTSSANSGPSTSVKNATARRSSRPFDARRANGLTADGACAPTLSVTSKRVPVGWCTSSPQTCVRR